MKTEKIRCESVSINGKMIDAKCTRNGKKLNKKDSLKLAKELDID